MLLLNDASCCLKFITALGMVYPKLNEVQQTDYNFKYKQIKCSMYKKMHTFPILCCVHEKLKHVINQNIICMAQIDIF